MKMEAELTTLSSANPETVKLILEELDKRMAPRVERYLEQLAERAALWTKQVMNADEAAAYLGCSRGWLYELSSTKQIASSKIGNKLFFARKDLESFAMQNRTRSEEEVQTEARRLVERLKKQRRR